jgi:pilus assembly protein CpaE
MMFLTDEELKSLSPEIRKKLVPLLSGAKNGKVLNFIGAKGGVGTTTIAVNVALGLCELEKQTALVDFNPLFGEVPIFLGIDPPFDWGEINASRLDSTYLMGILTKHCSGLRVLSSPQSFNGHGSSGMIEKLLSQMKGLFDYVVVDSGRQLDDNIADVIKISDSIFLVINLTVPCLVNVKKLLWTIQNLGYNSDRVKIIANQKGPVSVRTAAETIKKEIFWVVPENLQVATSAINKGEPILSLSGNSDISKSIKDLVKRIPLLK